MALADRQVKVLTRVGWVTDSPDDVIPELTPGEYWEFCAIAYSRFTANREESVATMLARAENLAVQLDFSPPRRSIAGFSLGMRRKTQLIAAMLHAPDLLVMDEPVAGLDFMSIRALEAVLDTERRRGALILMADHDLGLASRLSDRVIVLHLGRLVLDVRTDALPLGEPLEYVVETAIRLARTKGGRP
jgi:ABC-type multidrug transport system ATPase subunit